MAAPPAERRTEPGIDLVLAHAGLVIVGILLTFPALVVAIPLALLVDQRGWRRWPALVGGGAATAASIAVGAWSSYTGVWAELWNHIRFHQTMHWLDLFGLVPLAVPAGLAAGGLLPALFHNRNEHEVTRHHRELSTRRHSRAQAA